MTVAASKNRFLVKAWGSSFYAKKEPNHNDSVLKRLDSICQCLNLMTLFKNVALFFYKIIELIFKC